MEKVIEIKNLTKDYGFNRGVFDLSITVNKGETFGFLGPNGAGKTTTIRHLMGFSKTDIGDVRIRGKQTFNAYFDILKDVGYIPGELSFPDGLTGYEVISMMQDLKGIKNKERLEHLCQIFKLDHSLLKSLTKQMSLGTKRKLAIVTAFMSDPDILILDEPTSGLDPLMQDVFIEFIINEKKRGKTILLSSHIFNEVDQTCDRISIIKEGRIVDTFITSELKHDHNKQYVIKFKDLHTFNTFISHANEVDFIRILDKIDLDLKVRIITNDQDIQEVIDYLSTYEILEFVNEKETLEDYFLKFYKDGKEFKGI